MFLLSCCPGLQLWIKCYICDVWRVWGKGQWQICVWFVKFKKSLVIRKVHHTSSVFVIYLHIVNWPSCDGKTEKKKSLSHVPHAHSIFTARWKLPKCLIWILFRINFVFQIKLIKISWEIMEIVWDIVCINLGTLSLLKLAYLERY